MSQFFVYEVQKQKSRNCVRYKSIIVRTFNWTTTAFQHEWQHVFSMRCKNQNQYYVCKLNLLVPLQSFCQKHSKNMKFGWLLNWKFCNIWKSDWSFSDYNFFYIALLPQGIENMKQVNGICAHSQCDRTISKDQHYSLKNVIYCNCIVTVSNWINLKLLTASRLKLLFLNTL